MFITFEGVDWSGKSTQSELLAQWLREQGRTVLTTREPGGTPVGEAVRNLVLHGDEMSPWAEAALYAAARAENVAAAIRPALERGEDVVCDRYIDSSVAYQGAGRKLGEERVRYLTTTRHRRADARPDVPRAARSRGGASPFRRRPRPDRARRERVHAAASTPATGRSRSTRRSGSSRSTAAARPRRSRGGS